MEAQKLPHSRLIWHIIIVPSLKKYYVSKSAPALHAKSYGMKVGQGEFVQLGLNAFLICAKEMMKKSVWVSVCVIDWCLACSFPLHYLFTIHSNISGNLSKNLMNFCLHTKVRRFFFLLELKRKSGDFTARVRIFCVDHRQGGEIGVLTEFLIIFLSRIWNFQKI